jgi:MFS family permease
MQSRNLIVLVSCQLISATGSFVMVALGGIIGSTLTQNQTWATLPVSMMVVAVAATTIPATLLMRRLGRRAGFSIASLSAVTALIVATFALSRQSFALFIVAAMMFGINMAFTQQYRYAAAESVRAKYIPRAISFVLLGSIGGAFAGKALATQGVDWLSQVPYTGILYVLASLYVIQSALFLLLSDTEIGGDDRDHDTRRGLPEIVKQPVFLVAVLGGAAGYGLMTLIMTATPLSMHINDGYSVEQTTNVIRAHVLAMYAPSLVSGFLIERLGVARMMLIGAISMMAVSVIGLQGQTVMHYWWALVMLGIGWNFLYVGGTTMLTYTYSMHERFRAQAVNEFLVFGLSATASLLAGTVMHFFGWTRLMWVPLPILLAVCIALIIVRRDSLLKLG